MQYGLRLKIASCHDLGILQKLDNDIPSCPQDASAHAVHALRYDDISAGNDLRSFHQTVYHHVSAGLHLKISRHIPGYNDAALEIDVPGGHPYILDLIYIGNRHLLIRQRHMPVHQSRKSKLILRHLHIFTGLQCLTLYVPGLYELSVHIISVLPYDLGNDARQHITLPAKADDSYIEIIYASIIFMGRALMIVRVKGILYHRIPSLHRLSAPGNQNVRAVYPTRIEMLPQILLLNAIADLPGIQLMPETAHGHPLSALGSRDESHRSQHAVVTDLNIAGLLTDRTLAAAQMKDYVAAKADFHFQPFLVIADVQVIKIFKDLACPDSLSVASWLIQSDPIPLRILH